jgi:hypothetical protein
MARYAYAGQGAVDGGHDLRWSLRQTGRAGATFRNMDEPEQGGRADVGVRAAAFELREGHLRWRPTFG